MTENAESTLGEQPRLWPKLPESVQVVRHLWVDHGAIIRGKSSRTPGEVRMSQAQMAIPVHADVVESQTGLLPVHDVVLQPDWESARVLPWHPSHAVVMCDIVDNAEPWPHCPRTFLRRMDQAAQRQGVLVRVGVELEFTLLRDVGAERGGASDRDSVTGNVPVDDTAFCMDAAYDDAGEVIDDIVAALAQQGITVAQFHPESGPGQWEVSLRPLPLIAAADAVVALRQTVRSVGRRNGLWPSFVPVVDEHSAGAGMHLHISLSGDKPGLGPDGDAFVAGLLTHLNALLAVTAPSPISLLRFRPHYWVGAFAGWGVGNKEAPLRIVPDADRVWRDAEFKAADATANPYLALGCVVAAGLDGIASGTTLPAELTGDPGLLSETQRTGIGAWPLQQDPHVTLSAFNNSTVMCQAMGRALHGSYEAVRRADLNATAGWGFARIRDLWQSRM